MFVIRDAHVKTAIYCHFSLKNACSSLKWRLFCSIGRIDMIQSAFDRFTRIFSNGAIYEAFICIIEKNGAIFVILLHHFWMKISKNIENHAIISRKWRFFLFCDSMYRMTGFFEGYGLNEHILNEMEHTIPFIYINGAIFHRTLLIFS